MGVFGSDMSNLISDYNRICPHNYNVKGSRLMLWVDYKCRRVGSFRIGAQLLLQTLNK